MNTQAPAKLLRIYALVPHLWRIRGMDDSVLSHGCARVEALQALVEEVCKERLEKLEGEAGAK